MHKETDCQPYNLCRILEKMRHEPQKMNKKPYLTPRIAQAELRAESGYAASGDGFDYMPSGTADAVNFSSIFSSNKPQANNGRFNDEYNEQDINGLW